MFTRYTHTYCCKPFAMTVTGGARKSAAKKSPARKSTGARKTTATKKTMTKKAGAKTMEQCVKEAKKLKITLSKDGQKKTKAQLERAIARAKAKK